MIRLKASDGWVLTARYRRAKGSTAVVLLHGLAAGKEEWECLESELSKRGVATLAVDLRGHGGSLGPEASRGWRSFQDRGPSGEWASMWKDAEGGLDFLASQGYLNVGIAGASLGANVALTAASRLPRFQRVALLSPGLDYQGVLALPALQDYGPRRLLLAASRPDAYARQSSELMRRLRTEAGLPVDWVQAPSGHGVGMFQDARVLREVADWLSHPSSRPSGRVR